MKKAYNSIEQGLKEAIEYSIRDKCELLQDLQLAKQQIIAGKYLSDSQVEKRQITKYRK